MIIKAGKALRYLFFFLVIPREGGGGGVREEEAKPQIKNLTSFSPIPIFQCDVYLKITLRVLGKLCV